jgi:hypothetical protein
MPKWWLRVAIGGIGLLTLLTGALQALWPGLVLGLVGAARTPTSQRLFGWVGLGMVYFGAVAFFQMWHLGPAVRRRVRRPGLPWWAVVPVAGVLLLVSLVQVFLPGTFLAKTGWEVSPTTQHFWGIVWMFVGLAAGLALYRQGWPRHGHSPLLWASCQKFGAAVAVGVGVLKALFSPLALVVAGFDLFSGLLMAYCYWQIRPSWPQ